MYHLQVVHLQKHATRALQNLLRELDSRLHVEKIHLDLSRHCTQTLGSYQFVGVHENISSEMDLLPGCVP